MRALDRDRLAGEPVGIAAAVPAFVRAAHDVCDRSQRACGGDDPLADQRVLAHEADLFEVQRTWLVENRIRDRDLADVVQLGGAHGDVDLLDRQAHVRG